MGMGVDQIEDLHLKAGLYGLGDVKKNTSRYPIKEVKEKVLAAHRAGVKTVLCPMENKKDIRDIPKVVRNSITIVTVEHMDEVIPLALAEAIQHLEGSNDDVQDPLIDLLMKTGDEESKAPAVH